MILLVLFFIMVATMTTAKLNCSSKKLLLGDQCTVFAISDGAHPTPPCDYVIKPTFVCPYGKRSKGLSIPQQCKGMKGCPCSDGLVCKGPKFDPCNGGKGTCVSDGSSTQGQGEYCKRKGKSAPCTTPLVCVAQSPTESVCQEPV
jgi:hypothetical protein